MNITEVAELLNGVQYAEEGKILSLEFCKKLRDEGIVVVRGYSDDLIEFDGAISDEFGADKIWINSDGIIHSECECVNCPYFQKILKNAKYFIDPKWCETPEYAWTYDTNIPHDTFDVMEDEDKYCKGLVFKLSDLK
jgi:hypothetical protein